MNYSSLVITEVGTSTLPKNLKPLLSKVELCIDVIIMRHHKIKSEIIRQNLKHSFDSRLSGDGLHVLKSEYCFDFIYKDHEKEFITGIHAKLNDNNIKLDRLIIDLTNAYETVGIFPKIRALELATDFKILTKTIKKHIFFKGKKKLRVAEIDASNTTEYWGHKQNLTVLYDKEAESKKKIDSERFKNITRLEFKRKSNYLPTKNILDLLDNLSSPSFNPFKSIYWVNYTLSDNIKAAYFEHDVKNNGFTRARQIANKDKNFHRNKAKIFSRYKEIPLEPLYPYLINKFIKSQLNE